jgi:hypothetical protein
VGLWPAGWSLARVLVAMGQTCMGLFVSSDFSSLSVAAVAARRVDRPYLLEIEFGDGLQLVGQSRSFAASL